MDTLKVVDCVFVLWQEYNFSGSRSLIISLSPFQSSKSAINRLSWVSEGVTEWKESWSGGFLAVI